MRLFSNRPDRTWKSCLALATLLLWIGGCSSQPVEEPPADIQEIAVGEESVEPLPPEDVADVPAIEQPQPRRKKRRGLTVAQNTPKAEPPPAVEAPPPPAEPPPPPVEPPPPPPPPPEPVTPPPPPEPAKVEAPLEIEEPIYMQRNVQLAGLAALLLILGLVYFSRRNRN